MTGTSHKRMGFKDCHGLQNSGDHAICRVAVVFGYVAVNVVEVGNGLWRVVKLQVRISSKLRLEIHAVLGARVPLSTQRSPSHLSMRGIQDRRIPDVLS